MKITTFQLCAFFIGIFMLICYIYMLWAGNDDGAFGALYAIIAIVVALFISVEGRHDGKNNS